MEQVRVIFKSCDIVPDQTFSTEEGSIVYLDHIEHPGSINVEL